MRDHLRCQPPHDSGVFETPTITTWEPTNFNLSDGRFRKSVVPMPSKGEAILCVGLNDQENAQLSATPKAIL